VIRDRVRMRVIHLYERAEQLDRDADEIEAEVHGKVIASEWIRLGAAMLRLRAEIWRGITRS
jgi:hypothetical protein